MNYLFTTIYPGSKKFFEEFIKSVNNQTSKNFKLFIILNGTNLSKKYLKLIKTKFVIFKVNDTWQNARIRGLEFILKKRVNFIIFADSDDILLNDRVEVILNKVNKYDFIVNNMRLFKENLNQSKVWLKDKTRKIQLKEIDDKNFIGCGNTAVRSSALKKIYKSINNRLIAFDWCMAKLLLINGFKGIYIKEPLTLYRQYQQNTSSLTYVNKTKITRDIKCKLEHFDYFSKFGLNYEEKIIKLKELKKKIKFNNYLKDNLKKFEKKNQKYWWAIV